MRARDREDEREKKQVSTTCDARDRSSLSSSTRAACLAPRCRDAAATKRRRDLAESSRSAELLRNKARIYRADGAPRRPRRRRWNHDTSFIATRGH